MEERDASLSAVRRAETLGSQRGQREQRPPAPTVTLIFSDTVGREVVTSALWEEGSFMDQLLKN